MCYLKKIESCCVWWLVIMTHLLITCIINVNVRQQMKLWFTCELSDFVCRDADQADNQEGEQDPAAQFAEVTLDLPWKLEDYHKECITYVSTGHKVNTEKLVASVTSEKYMYVRYKD